jgi:hypothetical protein
MPFLFIDYDQGAGGEYICYALSQSSECEPINAQKFDSGRTKVQDIFNQEFLKFQPNVAVVPNISHRYVLVPTHRHTVLAKQRLGTVYSLRIQQPKDEKFWAFQKQQQIQKVLLAVEPTDQYFVGYVKLLKDNYQNIDFLSKVKRNMDNLTLLLMAQGKEPTEENRQSYIENLKKNKPFNEPNYQYNLTIPYESLFTDPAWVVEQIKIKFGINTTVALFEKFQNEFKQYQTIS